MHLKLFLDYFRAPFPKPAGFSPYRFPGLIVHAPVLLVFLFLGAVVTPWDSMLWPLFFIYLVVGVYVGRDLAIFAHYNVLITLGVIGGFAALVVWPSAVRAVVPTSSNLVFRLGVTFAVAAGFAAWVWWRAAGATVKR